MLPSQNFIGVLKWIWRFCLLMAFQIPNLESAMPKCKLCDQSFNSCSMQFPQYTLGNQDCRMEVYNVNNGACSSIPMAIPNRGEVSGKILLQSYFFQDELYTQTGFNVTFLDFDWKSITMRYTQNGNPGKNSCRVFHFSDEFLKRKPTSLFYDCLWSHNDYEEKTFNFEYTATNDVSATYRKSVFTVPRRDKINPDVTQLKNWQVFLYVDITESPFVILKAQTLPDFYNVFTYNVKVYSGSDRNYSVKNERNITVRRGENELTFEWNLGIFPGNYFFTVKPVSEECGELGCLISRSPDIKIEPSINLLFAGGAFAFIVLLIFIIACLKYIPQVKSIPVRPKLLLIYRSTHASHMKVVLELAQHLRKNCNIEAMFDELDVNKSETHNPFNWYNDAIAQCDFIAIVSSPTCCNSINGIYPKVDEVALNMLQGKGFNRKPLSNMCNLMVFLLPYCSEKTLPQEAKNIGLRFKIPNDINEIVNYIHNFKRKHIIGRLYYFIRSNIFWYMLHKRVSMKKCPRLHMAIQEASGEVKKCLEMKSTTELSVPLMNDKKICGVINEKGFHEIIDQPPIRNKSVSESSLYTVPYQSFPGNIEDYDLLGNESEVVEEEDLKLDIKEDMLLDGLTL
ncbi:uncharacterized protein [Hetaerina americana]|uniref:uncharacterized protein n=1 Tax=Hetaerina americana TaxID=62018 RepID=UPI003A7F5028